MFTRSDEIATLNHGGALQHMVSTWCRSGIFPRTAVSHAKQRVHSRFDYKMILPGHNTCAVYLSPCARTKGLKMRCTSGERHRNYGERHSNYSMCSTMCKRDLLWSRPKEKPPCHTKTTARIQKTTHNKIFVCIVSYRFVTTRNLFSLTWNFERRNK